MQPVIGNLRGNAKARRAHARVGGLVPYRARLSKGSTFTEQRRKAPCFQAWGWIYGARRAGVAPDSRRVRKAGLTDDERTGPRSTARDWVSGVVLELLAEEGAELLGRERDGNGQ